MGLKIKKELMEQEVTKNKPFAEGFNFYKAVWIFVIGCFIGCTWEVILTWFKTGDIVSRSGLIYGPFTPVYGMGALIYMYVLGSMSNTFKIFISSFFLGGFCEWLCSYLQEVLFGTISWDYSKYFLNIGGRTSLFHAIIWGMVGVLFIKIIYPYISDKIEKIPNKIGIYSTWILVIFMVFNISISILASLRQTERVKNIPPENSFEQFLDNTFSNEKMDIIYANKKVTGR